MEHIDWSFPVVDGPIEQRGRHLLQSNDSSREILHWDARTGRKVTINQRDCMWSTWTCNLGFPVLGIWPDYADGALMGQLQGLCSRVAHVSALVAPVRLIGGVALAAPCVRLASDPARLTN